MKLDADSMCTSSMRYTLNRPRLGRYWAFSSSSRVSSTRVREAASTSMRSMKRFSSISRQIEQVPAGRGGNPRLAVQALGENAGDGGLAHSAGAGEEVGVVNAPRIEPVAQRPDHVILADEAFEIPGTQPSG